MSNTVQAAPAHRGKGDLKGFTPPALRPPKINRDTGKHYTPWLFIRDAAGDVGLRPLPGGTVFWESPDVWVESSLGVNQPVVGEPNTVLARVTNFGSQYATGVIVKFWWANPSLAITEATANLIGVGHATVPSGWSVTVECPQPWIPVEENGGHECLIAEAYIPNFDPLTAPMDPVDDRHVGQKNEQLVMLKKGEHFRFSVEAANVFEFVQPMTFEVQPVLAATVHPLLAARALDLRAELKPPRAALALSLRFSDAAPVFGGPSVLFARRLLAMTKRQIDGDMGSGACGPAQIARVAQIEPWEARKLELSGQVPAGAEAGQTFAFRIVQSIGRIVTGGYTVNVVVI
jgi:hypothetical protein